MKQLRVELIGMHSGKTAIVRARISAMYGGCLLISNRQIAEAKRRAKLISGECFDMSRTKLEWVSVMGGYICYDFEVVK